MLKQLRCISQSPNCHTVARMKVYVLNPETGLTPPLRRSVGNGTEKFTRSLKEPGEMRGEAQSWSGLKKAVAKRPLVLMDPGQRESLWTHISNFWESLASTGEELLSGLLLRPKCSIFFWESWELETDQIWVVSGLTLNPTALSNLSV